MFRAGCRAVLPRTSSALVSRFVDNVRTICSSTRHTPSSVPYTPPENSGMNIDVFKALFQKPGAMHMKRRYQYRWDWHLRNFLMSLLPPAGLYLFLKLVDLKFKSNGIEYADIFVQEDQDEHERSKDGEKGSEKDEMDSSYSTLRRFTVEERLNMLEDQIGSLIDELEKKSDNMEKHTSSSKNVSASEEERVLAARSIAKNLQREGVSKCNDKNKTV